MRISTRMKWSVIAAAIAFAVAGATAQQTPPAGGRQGAPPPGGGRGPQPGGFQRMASLPFPDAPQVVETIGLSLRVSPMFKGLASPWSLAFLPNGDMLITEKPGRLRIVRGGTLDAAHEITPDVHIFTRSKVGWVTLPEGTPAFDVYYDSSTLWPPESPARLRAVLG